jgi:mono/diheme cytochrome c family protein
MQLPSRLRITGLVVLIGLAVSLLGFARATAQSADPAQVEQGARLYADNCAVCHGADGQGRVGATLAKNWPSIRPDLTIREVIEKGVSGSPMPAWGAANGGPLSEADIDALVAYILTWEPNGPRQIPPTPTYIPRPPVTPLPNVEGDPVLGGALFDENCVVCHGANGEGRVGARLAKNWPSLRPDLTVKATIERGIEGSPMPGWSQQNGGPLSEEQINHLVAFILTLPDTSSPSAEPTAAPASGPGLPGWAGVLLTVVLFILVVALAIRLQARKS